MDHATQLQNLQYRARRAAETNAKLETLDKITSHQVVTFKVDAWKEAVGDQLLCEVIRVGRSELMRQLTAELEGFLQEPMALDHRQ
jgi:hypothetical protein